MQHKHDAILILPRLRIQNANAISSPLTWGFPAPTAFAGFVHALQRRIDAQASLDISLNGVGIICHRFEPQVSTSNFTRKFHLSRNPVGQDGKSASLVEEGRVHLEVTLVIGAYGDACLDDQEDRKVTAERIAGIANSMRIAGGSILPGNGAVAPELSIIPEGTEEFEKRLRRWRNQWLPGFALVARDDLLADQLAQLQQHTPGATVLDAWMELSRLNRYPEPSEKDGHFDWPIATRPGWLVPLPIGYAAISQLYEPSEVDNARDDETPFRFVENLFSVGQWVSPHRLQRPEQIMWYHEADAENGTYLCRNQYTQFI